MSDYEDNGDNESDDYEYPSDDEEEEAEERANWERNVRAKESHISVWMDADDQDFRLWSEGSAIRMSIFSSLRQIVNSTCSKRILCAKDELFDENDIKTVRIFLDISEGMVVVYTLSFDSSIAITKSPPILKCISYCGKGTYIFPSVLLPNCHSQFVDFGKVFDQLSNDLLLYKSSFSSFIMVNEDSPYYNVQEIAYMTQYRTSFVFDLEDTGIITGLERDRKVKPGDGVGYSVGSSYSETVLKKDDSLQYKLTLLMNKIYNAFDERLLDSPLTELLSCMVMEVSVEEITRASQYAEALFNLISSLQNLYRERSVNGFSLDILNKLAMFKNVLSDEYGLQNITIPKDILSSQASNGRKRSDNSGVSPQKEMGSSVENEKDCVEPVIYIDNLFSRHSYLSESTVTGKSILKRMKIEFNTLSTSLPPTIKYMVSEENISLGKFFDCWAS